MEADTDSSRDVFEDPPALGDYVRRGGLRFVRPYYFDYFAYVKPRWEGATVVDLFTREFTGRSREYYQAALLAGRLRVDDTSMSAPRKTGGKRGKSRTAGDATAAAAPQDAPPPAPRPQPQPPPAQPAQDAPLQSGQRVRHFVHRHEPPVLDMPIEIVATTETAVAVCKPASMPVHPTGQYRKNSLMGILASEHAATLGRLCPVHRLDRNVSGLLVFARGAAAANSLRLQIMAGDVVKEYVACVAGAFPEGLACVVDAPLLYDYKLRRTAVGSGQGAKEAATAFCRLALSPDGTRSLVACRPLTGRTHQIRAHLHHHGFPIANDAAYGGVADAAACAGPGGDGCAGTDVAAEDDSARFAPRPRTDAAGGDPSAAGRDLDAATRVAEGGPLDAHVGGRHDAPCDELCTHCPWLAPQGQQLDVTPLWLHACRYAGQDWSFAAPLPQWAVALLPAGAPPELPLGLWDSLSPEALRRATAGGASGDAA